MGGEKRRLGAGAGESRTRKRKAQELDEGEGEGEQGGEGRGKEKGIELIRSSEFPYFDKETIDKLQIPHYSQSGRVMDSPFKLYRGVVPINGMKINIRSTIRKIITV